MAKTAKRRTGSDSRPWGIYARLSRKKPTRPGQRVRKDDESVERQVQLLRAHAAEAGLPISEAHIFIDNHLSAWAKSGANRPDWVRMTEAVSRGELRGMLMWKVDRFVRRMDDAVDIVKMAEQFGLLVRSPGSAGEYDLDTSEGRDDFYEQALSAAKESTRISGRVKVTLDDIRSQGEMVGGGRVFGYLRSSDPEHHPVEAPLLREAARRMLDHEPLAVIAAEFAERGVVTSRGTTFTAANLGRMLGAHRYGGKIMHHGDPTGVMTKAVLDENGEVISRAIADPILDADTYERVQTMLASRRRGRRATDKYPLTGIARCGRCGRTMAGATATKSRAKGTTTRIYRCPPQAHGCGMAINAEAVEDRVRDRVLELLADGDTRSAIGERDAALDDARIQARAHVDAAEAELVDLEVKKAMGEMLPAAYDAVQPILMRRHAKAVAELDEIGCPATGGDGGQLPEVTPAKWRAMNTPEQRQIITRVRLNVTVEPVFPDGPRNAIDSRRIVVAP